MDIEFTKMHGLGNDFVVIDAISQDIELTEAFVQALGDRHFGIGFDQLLIVEAPSQKQMDFKYRIFNASGEEVEQCGNGARCFARFVVEKQLTNKRDIAVETAGGDIRLKITDDQQVQVDMGLPEFEPTLVPVAAEQKMPLYRIESSNFGLLSFAALSMGNPHAVLLVDDVANTDVQAIGAYLESHAFFPKRVNVGFLQIINNTAAKLRVFERGVGETMACGTGACAAMVAAVEQGLLHSSATISLPGGDLNIQWLQGESVIMTGPASFVFEGKVTWPMVS